MNDFRLTDIIDLNLLQRLADSCHRAGGPPIRLVDARDAAVIVSAGSLSGCADFQLTPQRCLENYDRITGRLASGETCRFRCDNGFWHVAIPLIVSGRHLATLFLTDFLYEGDIPKREFIMKQAEELGYDPEKYLGSIELMPVFSREKMDDITSMNRSLVRLVSDMAQRTLSLMNSGHTGDDCSQYRTLFNNVNIGIYRHSGEQGRFIHVNPAMVRIFGYESVQDLMSVPVSALYQRPEERIHFIDEMRHKSSVENRELAMRKKDGSPILCSATVTVQYDDKGGISWWDGVIEDITRRKTAEEDLRQVRNELEFHVKARTSELADANALLVSEISRRRHMEDELRELSEKDPLTKVFNRRKLYELLDVEVEKARRYHRPISLIILDLDHYKRVNDMYGHNVGDTVLRTTTNIVENVIRKVDIFARYGGDEFMILCPETDLDGAFALAEKIRDAIGSHSFPFAGVLTISAGVAQLSREDTWEALIEKADKALYSAKNSGRNRVAAVSVLNKNSDT